MILGPQLKGETKKNLTFSTRPRKAHDTRAEESKQCLRKNPRSGKRAGVLASNGASQGLESRNAQSLRCILSRDFLRFLEEISWFEMRAAAWKSVLRFRNPLSPTTDSALFHSTPASFAKWRSKWDPDDEGTNQEPSKTYIRFSVHQKRSDAKAALKNLLFDGRSSQQYFQDEDITWSTDKKSCRNVKAKDGSHDFDKHQRSKSAGRPNPHSKGKRSANKRWRNRQSSYDEDDYEHPDAKFSATFGGQRCFTWSFTSGETLHFQNCATGFEWRDNSERIKTRKSVWSESDIEDTEDDPSDTDSQSHRVILGLPLTGPLKLDDVKHAFHATALRWHPDKHQGPSQAIAEEKFKLCVDAYNSLCKALKPS